MIPRMRANFGVADLVRAERDALRSDGRPVLIDYIRAATQAPYVVLAPSGRASITVLIEALGCTRVILPAYTCKSVVEAVLVAGAAPINIAVNAHYQMDLKAVANAAGPGVMIVLTHQFGLITDPRPYRKIADQSGAVLIEDAAAAFGGTWGGHPLGAHSDAVLYSFDATKIIHTPVKGGCITMASAEVYDAVQAQMTLVTQEQTCFDRVKYFAIGVLYGLLANPVIYGLFHFIFFRLRGRVTSEDSVVRTARNALFRLNISSAQAHLLIPQVDALPSIRQKRRALYAAYWEVLREGGHDETPADLQDGDIPTRFAFALSGDRQTFLNKALKKGMDFGTAFSHIAADHNFQTEHSVANRIVNAPLYPRLTPKERDRIIAFLRSSAKTEGY